MAVSISLAVISCTKDDDEPSDAERLITKAETENRDNEWDITGELHNAYLDFFISRRDEWQEGVNRTILLGINEDFFTGNDLTFIPDQHIAIFTAFHEMEEHDVDIGSENFQLSSICDYLPYFCELFPPDEPFPDLDFEFITSGNNTDKVLDFIERTRASENEIISGNRYNEEQKSIILQYYAVARYSHQYWHNQKVLGSDSPWDDYLGDDVIMPRAGGPIIRSDIRGAIIGFFTGGNALGGAAVASAAKAIDLLLEWLWDDGGD